MSYLRAICTILSTSGGPSGGGGNVSVFAGSPRPERSFSCKPPGVTIGMRFSKLASNFRDSPYSITYDLWRRPEGILLSRRLKEALP